MLSAIMNLIHSLKTLVLYTLFLGLTNSLESAMTTQSPFLPNPEYESIVKKSCASQSDFPPLVTHQSLSDPRKQYWLLSLDGGGVRGILHLATLAKLEEQTGKRIVDLFDGIAGTSIGGIIAAILTMPDPNDPSKPKYSPRQLLNIFFARGYTMFQPKWLSFNGILRTKYKTNGIKDFLANILGKNTFKNRWLPTVLVTHDLHTYNVKIFSTNDDEDFFAKDLAMATAAAPTYYKPQHVYPINNPSSSGYFVSDGGTSMSNPALAGIELIHKHYNAAIDQIHVFSLGTGTSNIKLNNNALRRGAGLSWMWELTNLFMYGQQSADINTARFFCGHRYHRLNPLLPLANLVFDDLSDENKTTLLSANEKMLNENLEEFNKVAASLTTAADVKEPRAIQDMSLVVIPEESFAQSTYIWVNSWYQTLLPCFRWLR
jgi:hypothetical protein